MSFSSSSSLDEFKGEIKKKMEEDDEGDMFFDAADADQVGAVDPAVGVDNPKIFLTPQFAESDPEISPLWQKFKAASQEILSDIGLEGVLSDLQLAHAFGHNTFKHNLALEYVADMALYHRLKMWEKMDPAVAASQLVPGKVQHCGKDRYGRTVLYLLPRYHFKDETSQFDLYIFAMVLAQFILSAGDKGAIIMVNSVGNKSADRRVPLTVWAVMETFYPSWMAKVTILNAPRILLLLWPFVRSRMSPTTKHKVLNLGGKVQKLRPLFENANNCPEDLGGKKAEDRKSFAADILGENYCSHKDAKYCAIYSALQQEKEDADARCDIAAASEDSFLRKSAKEASALGTKSGLLFCNGVAPLKGWKAYFAVLHEDMMIFYHKEDDSTPLAAISLTQTILLPVKREDAKKDHAFKLCRGNKELVCCAATAKERVDWAVAVSDHLSMGNINYSR
jgi:hypothetical protein